MKLVSRTCLTLGVVALSGFAMAAPAAAQDAAGCTANFVAAASNPPSSGETILNNPKFWLSDGIHFFPGEIVPYLTTVANYEGGAINTYLGCI
jgi:hypothetical protein